MSDEEDEEEEVSSDADEVVWDDETRTALRETLEWVIRGELRMAKNSPEQILDRNLPAPRRSIRAPNVIGR